MPAVSDVRLVPMNPRDYPINAEARARAEADPRFANELDWCWEEIAQLTAALKWATEGQKP